MNDLKIIDKQTLKLVDYLIALHKETQTNPDLVNDYSFGVKFYPHNKYIITHMRGKEVEGGKGKHAPHPLIINIGKEFNVDFNFFYNPAIEVKDAFLAAQKVNSPLLENTIDGVFDDIDKRLELFVAENKKYTEKEVKEFCEQTEKEIQDIKTHLSKAFATETLAEKRKEMTTLFDRMIFLSRRKIDMILHTCNLEQDINKMTQENQQFKEDKATLEERILGLHTDLRDCNKSLLEAKNGETDALKLLLAAKSKD